MQLVSSCFYCQSTTCARHICKWSPLTCGVLHIVQCTDYQFFISLANAAEQNSLLNCCSIGHHVLHANQWQAESKTKHVVLLQWWIRASYVNRAKWYLLHPFSKQLQHMQLGTKCVHELSFPPAASLPFSTLYVGFFSFWFPYAHLVQSCELV